MLLSFHTDIKMKFVYTVIIALICFGHAFSFDSGEMDLEGVISNDCSCKKLMLSTENEDTHLWQNSKLGLYEKQNYDVNNRIVYYNPIKKQYLFWESSRDGYWLFGPDLKQNFGGIVNKNCNDVKCPIDKSCKDGWRYTNGAIWKQDFNITLKCIDDSTKLSDNSYEVQQRATRKKKPGPNPNNPTKRPQCVSKTRKPPKGRRRKRTISIENRRARRRRTRRKMDNTCGCFKKRDCKSRKCSKCPHQLKCGKPLRRRCNEKKPYECCSGKCRRKRCSNCRCNKLRCNRNIQCCSQNCVRRRCETSKNCLRNGKRCTKTKSGTKARQKKPNTNSPTGGTNKKPTQCCAGSTCINKKCQATSDGCAQFNDPCTKKQDCCSKFCKRMSGGRRKCQNKNCKTSGTCQMNEECCSNNCNEEKKCGSEIEKCIQKDQRGCQTGGNDEKKCCSGLNCEQGTCIDQVCAQETKPCDEQGKTNPKCCSGLKCEKKRCIKNCVIERRSCKKPEEKCCAGLKCDAQKKRCLKNVDTDCSKEKASCGKRPRDKKCCTGLKCENKRCQKDDSNKCSPKRGDCKPAGTGAQKCCTGLKCVRKKCQEDNPNKCASKGAECKSKGTGGKKCCTNTNQKLECKGGRCVVFECRRKNKKCKSVDECCKNLKCTGGRCKDKGGANCRGKPCIFKCGKGCRCIKRICK